VFDSPRDILLWDTGHQAYVHKIVTGRRDRLRQLRQAGGLSGYPSRAESEHDWIENSHASTILSYAHGLATAQESAADGARAAGIVAVIGDGSLTGGMAFEGLNNLGHSGAKAIIILNDNGRSYAPTVSRSARASPAALEPRYVRNRPASRSWLPRCRGGRPARAGPRRHQGRVREMSSRRRSSRPRRPLHRPLRRPRHRGLEEALRNAAEFDGPIVVHVLTQKGRGYAPAENDPIKNLHDMGPARSRAATPPPSPRPHQGGRGAPRAGGHHRGHARLHRPAALRRALPRPLIDVGIAEQHAVTAAAGMAMGGLRPVVAVYSTFLTRAFDQVNLDVGLHGQPVVFCLDRAGITGDDGPSHHGVLDMVLLTKVPGMTMFAPSSYQELR
jgi:1-deoxy-D-xylulose-5-phosphate synthase